MRHAAAKAAFANAIPMIATGPVFHADRSAALQGARQRRLSQFPEAAVGRAMRFRGL